MQNIGWKQWTEEQNFGTDKYTEKNSFKFKLSEAARLLTITNSKQLDKLPKIKDNLLGSLYTVLDFEKLKEKYDAIEVLISAENVGILNFRKSLYWSLYGWDCDSILILNKNVVQEVKR